ncbi:MAG TPA: hypothetical protein VF549_13955 [Solirubrobacteraceae bacterium]|jgi:hypothetical protein
MTASTAELIYDLSLRALNDQRARLENLRSRAATLLSAAGIVTSFLGAEAIKDTHVVGGQVVTDHAFQGAEIAGLAAFGLLGLACIFVIWPRSAAWQFEPSAAALIAEYKDHSDTDAVRIELAEVFESSFDKNEPKVVQLFWAFRIGAVLLFAEIVAWLIELA